MTSDATANLPETKCGHKNFPGIFPSGFEEEFERSETAVFRNVWKDRIDEPRINYHPHVALNLACSRCARECDEGRFDFFDFFPVMVVSVHVRCKSMKYSGSEGVRHKESQSGSKFSGRRNESPNAFAVCERTVDGEKKNRSDTPIVVPVKIVIFISQRRDTCRERERRKKKYIRRSPRFRPKASGENSKYFKKKGKKEFLISIYSIRDTTKKRKKSNVLFCLRSWIKISMCEAYINPRCWEARMDHKSNVSVAIQIQHKFNVNTDTNMYYNISWWETSYWWAIIFIVESLCLGFG